MIRMAFFEEVLPDSKPRASGDDPDVEQGVDLAAL